ncbi:MAG: radical SAM protein [Deltaproteobacteria bacterium]|nr:radical SAM protein [Deltaproteobacteria bacterium]
MSFEVRTPDKSDGCRYGVQVRFSPNQAATRSQTPAPQVVELLGEPADWLNGIRLARTDDTWSTALELPCGVYSYKLRVDGTWMIDDDNPRTRGRGGHRNSVLSVGGAPEPVLFASALPWVFEDADGATVITAALRRSAGDTLRLVWSECDSRLDHQAEMLPVMQEDEHALFRARVSLSAAYARVAFALRDGTRIGREDGEPFLVRRPLQQDPPPGWWLESSVYAIFVDRFRPERDRDDWGKSAGRDQGAGGHLEGIRRSLDELEELGVNALYLTPIHLGAHCHRYDLVDPMRVDPALGGEEAFRRLLDDAHGRGMRVLLDLSFAHVGRGFPAYEDVLQHGRSSAFADWFQWKEGGSPRLAHYGKRRDAPLLDLHHPDVKALVVRAAEKWADMGVDGLRLDAAAEVPHELAREVRARLKAIRPEALVLGEVVPEHAWRWRVEGGVDATTDFGFHAAVTEFIAKRAIDASEASRWMEGAEVARGGPDCASVRFLSTHDHTRFATFSRMMGDPGRAALGLLVLLTSPGVPAILYGEEIGLAADMVELLPEAVWEDRAPMPWTAKDRDEHLRELVRRLLATRAASPALLRGSRSFVFADGPLLVYRRAANGEVIDVAVNASDVAIEFDMEDDQLDQIEPLVAIGDARVAGQGVTLGANAGLVARRRMSASRIASQRRAFEANLKARDSAFAAGSPQVGSRPTRIDLTVTERCNMRCRHCINDSPQRTQEGTARTLTHAVIDRLREDFSFADYFGFVHGGESLSAPIFFDVLQAIRSSVGSRPYGVHLLTNGLLLTADTARRFIELGGTSISISLDGASAAVNDSIRAGFECVIANVRQAVQVRNELSADLRIGLSCVVMQRNLAELQAFVELGASLGVDWIKLEELVSKGELGEQEVAGGEAVARAMARGRALGLVMVDHTSPPEVWRCRLDQDMAAAEFLAADQFANRSEIHPCRAPWDVACIDPNGDVHAADFFRPVLGNVMQQPLSALWDSALARAERVREKARWICAGGEMKCTRTKGV